MTKNPRAMSVLDSLARTWGAVWTVASVAIVVVVAVLPDGDRWALFKFGSMLPLMALLYWTLEGRTTLTLVLAFGAGVAVDFLSQSALGYWALINLIVVETAIASTGFARRGWIAKGLVVVGCLGVAAVTEWLLYLAFAHNAPDVAAVLEPTLVAIASYPFLALVLYALSPPRAAVLPVAASWGMR
jgi:rod shape-determining protein MreD